MTIWLTSDTHFNHENIIFLADRPFASLSDMNNALIENWNNRINPQDEVWHLGDFGLDNKRDLPLENIFKFLRGQKNLIIGNHDEQTKKMLKYPWNSIQHYKKIRCNGESYILCHYPFQSWNGQNAGRVHLHGHCHGTLRTLLPNRIDVGVDCQGYHPINLEDVPAKIALHNEGLL